MSPNTIQSNRLQNLLVIIDGYKSKKAFCEDANLNASQLSQILNQSRPISDSAARKIEAKLALDAGYMDRDNSLPLGYVGIEDAAKSVINLVEFLQSKDIAMHQWDQEVLYRLLKFIFADVTDRGQVTSTQLENLLALTQA